MRTCGITAGVGVTLAISACGGGQNQAASRAQRKLPGRGEHRQLPRLQRLSQHTHLVITVRNAGSKAIPDVAVTICNVTCAYPAPKGEGSSSAGVRGRHQPDLPGQSVAPAVGHRASSRPLRLQLPERRAGRGGDRLRQHLGPGAPGPGQTARFDWAVTAVQPGRHVVAWQVAAGLNGKAKAVLSNGAAPHGSFAVEMSTAPAQSYVNNNGQIVTKQ